MPFRTLGLIEPLLKAIEEMKICIPSEIQTKAIPLINEGKDVIGGSATGSGKTLAFGASIVQKTIAGLGIQALILTPTRELTVQVAREMRIFSKYKPVKVVTVYGGVSITPQMEKLPTAEVVVGTPGRILDHLSRKTIDLSKVRTLVLDEADIMLDMGFLEDVERIIRACPRQRQTLLFSATITRDIQRLSSRYMIDPVKVSAQSQVDPKKLKQYYYNTSDNKKFSLLVHLLKSEQKGMVMIFTNTRSNTEFVAKQLKKNGLDAIGIHGGLTQAKRQEVMSMFDTGRASILVCTDVAARGLDIKGVDHIYNYDVPKDPRQYIHRIGRTARAGSDGDAKTVLSPRDHDNFRRVLAECDVKVEKMETPEFRTINLPRATGGFRGDDRRPNPRMRHYKKRQY